MKIRWTTEAAENLEYILRHVEQDNPEAALRTVRAIFDHIIETLRFPKPRPQRA